VPDLDISGGGQGRATKGGKIRGAVSTPPGANSMQNDAGPERQEFSRGMGRDGGIRRNHGDRKRGVRGGGGRTARMNVNLVVAGLLLACRASSAFRFAPAGPSSVIARGGGSSCNGRSPVSRRSGSAGIQSACWAGGAGIFGSAKPTFQQRR